MYPALLTAFLGLLASTSWGIADFFATKASRHSSAETTTFWVSAIGALAFIAIYVVMPGMYKWNIDGVVYAIAAGASLELGLLMLFKGLSAGPVSIVSPISSAYPIVTLCLMLFVFAESISRLETVGIFITVSGLVLASGSYGHGKNYTKFSKGVVYGIVSILLLGLAYTMLGESVLNIGWQKSAVVNSLSGLFTITATVSLIKHRNIKKILREDHYRNKYVLLTAFAQILGGIVFMVGLSIAQSTAVISAIAATYPLLTIFLAVRYLDEKIRIVSLTGAFIAVIGVVLLSL